MPWLGRVTFSAADVLTFTDINNIGNDIRTWGGNINGGGFTLSNVVLSPVGGKLGLGTQNPARRLQIHETAPDAHIYISGRSGSIAFGNNEVFGSSTMFTVIAQATLATDFGRNAGDLLVANYGASRGDIVINANYSGAGVKQLILQPGGGNVSIGTELFGTSANKVLSIGNGTAPTSSPAAVGQLWVEGGALKYRGSSGTVTTLGAA